jgi:hypothetical protein
MKYLKIENNNVFFKNSNDEWNKIDTIDKNDLLYLVDKIITEDEFEMDEYDEELIANKAHQIIYKNLYDKFSGLLENKTRFHDESRQLYREAFEKYQVVD